MIRLAGCLVVVILASCERTPPVVKSAADVTRLKTSVAKGTTEDLVLSAANPGADIMRTEDNASAVQAYLSGQSQLLAANSVVVPELAKRNPGILLVHTSFPGAATRCLLERLPGEISFRHFGDSDPAGFEILRDLREKTRRAVLPVGMEFRANSTALSLTDMERKTLERLIVSPVMEDVRPALQEMLDHGTKGDFEQESLGHAGLIRVLEQL